MLNTIVNPPEKHARLHNKFSYLAMYIGKVVVDDDTRAVTPCRGITHDQLHKVTHVGPPNPDAWTEGSDGSWTPHVSVRVDVDDAIARLQAEAGDYSPR